MSLMDTTLIALAFSAVPILLLCAGDPKRRRSAQNSAGMAVGMRRLLAALSVVPGVVCAASGDFAALLMWLGGCALVGWTATLCCRDAERPAFGPGITDQRR